MPARTVRAASRDLDAPRLSTARTPAAARQAAPQCPPAARRFWVTTTAEGTGTGINGRMTSGTVRTSPAVPRVRIRTTNPSPSRTGWTMPSRLHAVSR